MLGGEAGAGSDLAFVAPGDGEGKAAGDEADLAGFEKRGDVDGGGEVETGGVLGHTQGEFEVVVAGEALELDGDGLGHGEGG